MNKISCIYIIKNIVTNTLYIGSTINFEKRKKTHLRQLAQNKHHSKYLQRSFNKWGLNNFKFEIYHYCKKEDLLELEQYYLNTLKPKFNVSISATGPMTGRNHSEEAKQKMKNHKRPNGCNHYRYGKKLSFEEKIKLSLLRKSKNFKHSEETKQKMRKTAIERNRFSSLKSHIEKNKKRIIDENGVIYESLTDVAKTFKCSISTVCDVLKGRSKKLKRKVMLKYYE